jgi:hypothetical protein
LHPVCVCLGLCLIVTQRAAIDIALAGTRVCGELVPLSEFQVMCLPVEDAKTPVQPMGELQTYQSALDRLSAVLLKMRDVQDASANSANGATITLGSDRSGDDRVLVIAIENGLIFDHYRQQWTDQACVLVKIVRTSDPSTLVVGDVSTYHQQWSDRVDVAHSVVQRVKDSKGELTAGQVLHKDLGIDASNWHDKFGRGFSRSKIIGDALELALSRVTLSHI